MYIVRCNHRKNAFKEQFSGYFDGEALERMFYLLTAIAQSSKRMLAPNRTDAIVYAMDIINDDKDQKMSGICTFTVCFDRTAIIARMICL